MNLAINNGINKGLIAYIYNTTQNAKSIEFVLDHMKGNTLTITNGTLGAAIRIEKVILAKESKHEIRYVCICQNVYDVPQK